MSAPRLGLSVQKLSAVPGVIGLSGILAPVVRVWGGPFCPSTGAGVTELRSSGNPGRLAFGKQEVLA